MRSDQEVMNLLLAVAKADERIRAVVLSGSRANPEVAHDPYQDFDITYYVTDMAPYYNQPQWVTEQFGQPLIMQMPEIMREPDGGGHFTYLMIFPDGIRIDLTCEDKPYRNQQEPDIVLLDKDQGNGLVPRLAPPDGRCYHVQPPNMLFYSSCCNNFWWCLNNVAKGIARNELPYVMVMLNEIVRAELHDMIAWSIGVDHGFSVSAGKMGKYYRLHLAPDLYERYAATYPTSAYKDIWRAIEVMMDLFHELAIGVGTYLGYAYNQGEEDGLRSYLRLVRDGALDRRSD